MHAFYSRAALRPRWMPDAEKLLPPTHGIERRVTLHQPLVERTLLTLGRPCAARQRGLIGKLGTGCSIHDAPSQPARFAIVFVTNPSVPIWQTERARPQAHRQPVRQPLRQELYPRLTVMPHLGSHV